MAKTLLQSVNAVLKKVGEFHGDSEALTTLTSTARQRQIDIAVQSINEGIDELYTVCEIQRPNVQSENTVMLVQDQRNGYTLASDMTRLLWPFVDRTNTQYIFRFPQEQRGLLLWDIQQDDTGTPHYGAINPEDGTLTLDRAPDANVAGRTYYYQYEKDLELGVTTDTVPFSDAVYRAMVPVWAQLWRRELQKEFDPAILNLHMGRASRFLTQAMPRSTYHNK